MEAIGVPLSRRRSNATPVVQVSRPGAIRAHSCFGRVSASSTLFASQWHCPCHGGASDC